MAPFAHTSLRVYHAAVEVWELVVEATRGIPRRFWPLEQQLLRATSSIALNIAEGAAEFSPGEKTRLYRTSLRSAAESSAALELFARNGAMAPEVAESITLRLEGIGGMLMNMIIAVRSQRTPLATRSAAGPGKSVR
jgi:four helix bundle protein